jgi:hypothetical protein
LLFEPQVLRCLAAGPGGRPLQVLIDTGTDPSAIDLNLARRLDLRLGEFALGSDATSNQVPFTETWLPWLRLADLTIRDLYLLAVDLSRAPFPVDLVLGYSVLSRLTLTVSFADRSLCLRHPDLDPPPPAEGGAVLPLHFVDRFPALAGARLCAPDPIELPLLAIDTGSNGGLTLGVDLAEQAGLSFGAAAVRSTTGQGFASDCEVLTGAGSELQLGPFQLQDVALDAPAASDSEMGRAGRATIGNRLLARFAHMTLDYRRGVCVLDP